MHTLLIRGLRLTAVLVVVATITSGCSNDERREIRLTPTSTVETGVRILVDNCPGPTSVALSVRQDVLWEIAAPATPTTDPSEDPATTTDAATTAPEPGLREFLVGQAPDDWTTVTALAEPLQPGIRYTISTEPDGQTIDFSTPDLAPGLLWDGAGNSQFNPALIDVECSAPADFGKFARNLLILVALGVTAAASVLVALILVLFVITRRFSRVRSIQKQGERPPGTPASPEPQKVGARSSR